MKKTTLFTTLALVVIVAIALSTATFAWYSANSDVTVNKINYKASTASSANLTISANSTVGDLTEITFDEAANVINPSMLKNEISTSTVLGQGELFSILVDNQNKVTATATPTLIVKEFWVKNNGDAEAKVKATINGEGELLEKACYALYYQPLTEENNGAIALVNRTSYKHNGGKTVEKGNYIAGANKSDTYAPVTVDAMSSADITIDAGQTIKCSFLVWFDGDAAVNTDGDHTCAFSISIGG